MRVAIATTYRILLALAAGSVVVLQALILNKLVHWSPWTVVTVAAVVAGVTFLDNLRLLFYKFQAHQREASRSRMHTPLIGALNAVATARDVPLESLGISVFAIRKYLGMKWYLIPWLKQRLKRVFRFRLSDYPPESNVRWTKGKGTIGDCWQTGVAALHDRRPTAKRYGKGHHPTEQEFSTMSAADRSGFTRTQFIQTIDKYGEILAVPIVKRNTGALLGVLSIDCLASAYAERKTSVLGGAAIEEIAGGAAFTVRDDVPRF